LPNCLAAFHGFDLNKQTNKPKQNACLREGRSSIDVSHQQGNRTSFLESVTISEPGKYLKNDVICYQRIFAGVGEHFGMLQKITIGYFSVTL